MSSGGANWIRTNVVQTRQAQITRDGKVSCPVPDVDRWRNEFTYGQHHGYRVKLSVGYQHSLPKIWEIICSYCARKEVNLS